MAQAAAIMQIIGAAASFTSGMLNAFGEKYTAESNANAYRAQAQNIGVQQKLQNRWPVHYELRDDSDCFVVPPCQRH